MYSYKVEYGKIPVSEAHSEYFVGCFNSIPVQFLLFVCLFLILYVPSTIFRLCRDWSSWVETSTKLGLMCLAQGHNEVTPVRLESVAFRSQVKHSTTEQGPLRSLGSVLSIIWIHH